METFDDARADGDACTRFPEQLLGAAPVDLFVSDPHGEHTELSHILRSASGLVPGLIEHVFPDPAASQQERDELASFVCYPLETLSTWRDGAANDAKRGKLSRMLEHLACAALGEEALLCGEGSDPDAQLMVLADAVRRSCVRAVHLVGDVYDRGPSPDKIIDELIARNDVDVQWGNHDIVWMGAALGQAGCIAHVVRNCARYGNLDILSDAYGMDLSMLERFALDAYRDDPCVAFGLKGSADLSPAELELNVKIQKAMAIVQFKVEGALIDANPSFELQGRKLLHHVDFAQGSVELDGVRYELTDKLFPTVDPLDPYALTEGEAALVEALSNSFRSCERLQAHVRFLLEHGSLYKVCGSTLAFHACVPLEEDGSFKEVDVYGAKRAGKALFDEVERYVRVAFDEDADALLRERGRDLLWYLWLGQGSPLFAKSKMATFELYLIAEKEARVEVKNPFYSLLDDAGVVGAILGDFGIDPCCGRIVCGHVPVKVIKGEDPVKCGGKAVIIDGGMSKPYRKTTGVAGMTLLSAGAQTWLAAHRSFAGPSESDDGRAHLVSAWRRIG